MRNDCEILAMLFYFVSKTCPAIYSLSETLSALPTSIKAVYKSWYRIHYASFTSSKKYIAQYINLSRHSRCTKTTQYFCAQHKLCNFLLSEYLLQHVTSNRHLFYQPLHGHRSNLLSQTFFREKGLCPLKRSLNNNKNVHRYDIQVTRAPATLHPLLN